MKHYVFSLLTLSILFLASCNNTDPKNPAEVEVAATNDNNPQIPLSAGADKELVAQMEADISKMQSLMPEFQAKHEIIKSMRMEIKQSYSGDANSPTYAELLKIYEQLAVAMKAYSGFRESTGKLITLSSEHASGKVNASDAKKQYAEIKESLDQKVATFTKVKDNIDNLDQEIKKVFSNANIKAGGGK